MGTNCGIVGLPNVGKSTIFQALTSAPAEAKNYPFCTIDPNIGIVDVLDSRIEKISSLIQSQKTVLATMEFVDIAGLVKGASKGEGLGNQFLGHIRQVDAIAHVVRCFEDDDIIHVHGKIDPIADIETINLELCLADLETAEKRKESLSKMLKSHQKDVQKKARQIKPLLENLISHLGKGLPARTLPFDKEELKLLEELHLITMKKLLYVCNVDEDALEKGNSFVDQVASYAKKEGSGLISICGKIESEIAALETRKEREEFLLEIGHSSGLDRLTACAYQLLGLKTYFTAGPKEARAWTYRDGMTAEECAGIIHSDFQRGFIKAEIYHFDDLMELKSEQNVRKTGKLRLEGKQYKVCDGDIIHFKFNV